MARTKTQKDATIKLRLPEKMKEDFQKLCELKGTSTSSKLREYIAGMVNSNRELLKTTTSTESTETNN